MSRRFADRQISEVLTEAFQDRPEVRAARRLAQMKVTSAEFRDYLTRFTVRGDVATNVTNAMRNIETGLVTPHEAIVFQKDKGET